MNNLKNTVKKIIVKHEKVLIKMAQTEAVSINEVCRAIYYQPPLPVGLDEFTKEIEKRNKHIG